MKKFSLVVLTLLVSAMASAAIVPQPAGSDSGSEKDLFDIPAGDSKLCGVLYATLPKGLLGYYYSVSVRCGGTEQWLEVYSTKGQANSMARDLEPAILETFMNAGFKLVSKGGGGMYYFVRD